MFYSGFWQQNSGFPTKGIWAFNHLYFTLQVQGLAILSFPALVCLYNIFLSFIRETFMQHLEQCNREWIKLSIFKLLKGYQCGSGKHIHKQVVRSEIYNYSWVASEIICKVCPGFRLCVELICADKGKAEQLLDAYCVLSVVLSTYIDWGNTGLLQRMSVSCSDKSVSWLGSCPPSNAQTPSTLSLSNLQCIIPKISHRPPLFQPAEMGKERREEHIWDTFMEQAWEGPLSLARTPSYRKFRLQGKLGSVVWHWAQVSLQTNTFKVWMSANVNKITPSGRRF